MTEQDLELVRYDYIAKALHIHVTSVKVYAATKSDNPRNLLFPKPWIVAASIPYFRLVDADQYIEQMRALFDDGELKRGRPANSTRPADDAAWKKLRPRIYLMSELSTDGDQVGYEYFAERLGVKVTTIRNQTRKSPGFPAPIGHVPGRGAHQTPRFSRKDADAFIQRRQTAKAAPRRAKATKPNAS